MGSDRLEGRTISLKDKAREATDKRKGDGTPPETGGRAAATEAEKNQAVTDTADPGDGEISDT